MKISIVPKGDGSIEAKVALVVNATGEEAVSLGEVKKIDRSTGSTIIHGVGWHLIIEHKSGIKHKIEGSL